MDFWVSNTDEVVSYLHDALEALEEVDLGYIPNGLFKFGEVRIFGLYKGLLAELIVAVNITNMVTKDEAIDILRFLEQIMSPTHAGKETINLCLFAEAEMSLYSGSKCGGKEERVTFFNISQYIQSEKIEWPSRIAHSA